MHRHSPNALCGVYFDEDASRVEIVPGVSVPETFSYAFSSPDVPLTATVHIRMREGVAICERVEVDRHDGRSITAQDVRSVNLGQIITDAPQIAAATTRSGPIYTGDPALVGEEELERLRRALAAKPNIPVDLAVVAEVYRAALRAGKAAPTREVAETFDLTPRTASRRVADARKAGLLGEALERRAGEKASSGGGR